MAQAQTRPRTRIRKNDMVMVVKGRDRGKTGKVMRVDPSDGRVLVERLNMVKRHSKARGAASPGGIIEKEALISAANVMFFCERCNAPVRLGIRFNAEGERNRVCRRCGEAVGND
jgi:large subunit ribosomal protein L24